MPNIASDCQGYEAQKKSWTQSIGEKEQALLCLSATTSNHRTSECSGCCFTSASQIFHKLLFGPTLSEPYMGRGTGNILPNINTLITVWFSTHRIFRISLSGSIKILARIVVRNILNWKMYLGTMPIFVILSLLIYEHGNILFWSWSVLIVAHLRIQVLLYFKFRNKTAFLFSSLASRPFPLYSVSGIFLITS